MIYLDNAATTQIDPEILKAMCEVMARNYGNPNAQYKLGREAHDIIEIARGHVANLIHCSANNVIFTSGGAEGNSAAIEGLIRTLFSRLKPRILVSEGEHDSVVRAMESMRAYFEVLPIKLEPDGCVSVSDLESKIDYRTGLVSVMYVNNETGAINPVEEIGAICKKYGALFHTDCVQALGTVEIDVDRIGCDFLTASGHKIHGPKGSGFLYARQPALLKPIVFGSEEQEFGYRGGTQNVPAIFALGMACKQLAVEGKKALLQIVNMKQSFWAQLVSRLEEHELSQYVHINANSNLTPGKILNFRIDGVDAQTAVLYVDSQGVCISAGSACRSLETHPSRVLTAMGLTEEEAKSSIRVSFSKLNTEEEALKAADIIAEAVQTLREYWG